MAAGRRAAPSGCGRRRRARGCRAGRRDRAAARGRRRIRGRRRPRPVGRCPIWRCRVGPRPRPVGGLPPARPASRQARSVAVCSPAEMVSGSVIGSSGRKEVAGGTPPDAPSLARFLAWLSSSTCQGTSLPNGSTAPLAAGVSYLRRRCCLREETGRLEKSDDGSMVATGRLLRPTIGVYLICCCVQGIP